MENLLKLAIEAHGGLERWRQFNVVRANASITEWCLRRTSFEEEVNAAKPYRSASAYHVFMATTTGEVAVLFTTFV